MRPHRYFCESNRAGGASSAISKVYRAISADVQVRNRCLWKDPEVVRA